MPTRQDPFRQDRDWYLEIEGHLRSFGTELSHRPRVAARKTWEPRIDVFEEERRILVRAEVPGVEATDVEVIYHAESHSLLVRGCRRERREDLSTRRGVHQLEILYGDFEREVRLPDSPIDSDAIVASFRDGMLAISLPKIAPRRRRPIVVGRE